MSWGPFSTELPSFVSRAISFRWLAATLVATAVLAAIVVPAVPAVAEDGSPVASEDGSVVVSEDGSVVVNMSASQWFFKPNRIPVPLGAHVKFVVHTTDVRHGFKINKFGINKQLEPNQDQVIEFTADKTGVFLIECSVFCGVGHAQTKAKLIVGDAKESADWGFIFQEYIVGLLLISAVITFPIWIKSMVDKDRGAPGS